MANGAVWVNGDGESRFFYEEEFGQAEADGWRPRSGDRVLVKDSLGSEATVASERLPRYLEQVQGSELGSVADADIAQDERIEEETYGDVGGGVAAFGAGVGRGLSLGLSDAVLVELGVDPEELAALRRVQGGASLAGEVLGAAAPALIPGGGALGLLARTPAGLVARAGEAIVGVGARGGLAGRLAAGAAAGAVEGGAFGGGQALSDAIIDDKPLTAEAFLASVGSGALYGGAFGAGAEAVSSGVGAVARGVKKIAAKTEDAAESVARRVDEAVSRRLQKTDDLLTPGPRTASADELAALRSAGDNATTEATALLGAREVSTGRKAVLSKRIDDLAEATRALDAGADVAQQADAVTRYHKAVEDLAGDLGKSGRKIDVPTNPVKRTEVDGGAVATVGDLIPEPSKAARAQLRSEVQTTVTSLDSTAAPMIEEARRIVAAQKPIEDAIGGQTFAELMGEVEGASKLAGLVKRAENAQEAFQKAFGVGSVQSPQLSMFAGKTSDDVLDALLGAPPAEMTAAVKKMADYHRATADLAAELDALAPAAAAPPRAAQLSRVSVPGRAGKPPAPAPFEGGWDAGDILAVADMAGLDIEDVPVLGQIPGMDTILKARLAYRRLKGGLDKVRLAGASAKVGGVAARARAVRDGLDRAVKGFISAAPRAARAAIPAASAILHGVSYGGSETPENETREEAFTRISEELTAAAGNTAQLTKHLRGRLDLDIPALVDPIVEAARQKILYLAGALPKDPREPSLLRSPWQPDDIEIDEFAERVWAAENPMNVLRQMDAGRLTPAAAETLREVYPALFGELQQRMVEEISETQAEMPHDRQVQLSVLLDLPVSGTEEPGFIAAMQQGYQPATPGPQPGGNVRMEGIDKMKFQPTAAEGSAF